MKRSMAGEITVAGECRRGFDRNAYVGGAVELAPFEHVRDHGGCGAEVGLWKKKRAHK